MTNLIAKFDMMRGHVRTVAEAFITEWFGERCPEHAEGCECCERWNALDKLLNDVFKDDRERKKAA